MSNTPRRKAGQTKKSSAVASKVNTGLGSQVEWGKIIGRGLAAIVVVAVLAAVLLGGDPLASVPEGLHPDTRVVTNVPAPAHIDGDIAYEELSPPGGPHNGIWQNCGFYEGIVRPENVLHSLEHAAVWVTYRSDLPQDQIDSLSALTQGRSKLLVSRQPLQDAPIVATAWGYQYEAQTADEEGLLQFVRELHASADAPEPRGTCAGGVSTSVL